MAYISPSTLAPSAALSMPEPGEEYHPGGPFGFVWNLFGDVQDFAIGMGQLAMAGITDVVNIPRDLFGGTIDNGYNIPRMFKMLPTVLKQDYTTRYGSLFRGDLPEFGQSVWEHPLTYFLDALTVADAAGIAAKLTGAASISAAAARGTEAGIRALEASKVIGSQMGKAYGVRAGLELLEQAGELNPPFRTIKNLLPATTEMVGGVPGREAITVVKQAKNPLVRKMLQQPYQRLTTQPLRVLEDESEQLAQIIRSGAAFPGHVERFNQLTQLIPQARQAGLRVQRPAAAAWQLRKGVDRMVSEMWMNIMRRNAEDAKAIEGFAKGLTPEEMELAHGELQRLSIGMSSHGWNDIDVNLGPEELWDSRSVVQPTADIQMLREMAVEAQQEVMPKLFDLFHGPAGLEPGGRERVLPLVIKSVADMERKSRVNALRLAGVRGTTALMGATAIEDVLSIPVVLKNWREASDVVQRLRSTFDIAAIDNFLGGGPGGIRGVRVYVRAGNGVVSEVHLMTERAKNMWEASAATRRYLRQLEERTTLATAPNAQGISPTLSHMSERELAMTRMYYRSLWGGVAREIERDITGRAISPIEDFMENMRAFIEKRWVSPQIEEGVLTPAEALNRAMRPLKFKHGAEFDFENGTIVGGPDELQLARDLDDAGLTQPIYFPHFDIRRFPKRSTFLASRGPHGARAAAKPGYTKFNQMFLLQHDLYLKDPIQAYTYRAAAANRWEETVRWTQKMIDEHGRPISDLDQLMPEETYFDPDGLWRFWRMKMKVGDDVLQMARKTMPFDDAFAESLLDTVGAAEEEVLNMLSHNIVGVSKNKLYAIPKVVGKRLEQHAANWFGEMEKNIRLFWDSPMRVWRWMVLAASPRWWFNNMGGNLIFAKMQGARWRDTMHLAADRFRRRLAARLNSHSDLLKTDFTDLAAQLTGLTDVGTGFFSASALEQIHLGMAEETLVGRFYNRIGDTFIVKRLSNWGDVVRKANEVGEQVFREASFIEAVNRAQLERGVQKVAGEWFSSMKRIRRIAENGIPEGVSVKSLIDEVNKWYGDYVNLGPFERKVVRRFLVPFYGFYKHIVKLTARFPIERPLRALLLNHLAQTSREMAAEIGPVPEWVQSGWPMGPGLEPGSMRFASTAGLNPFNAFSQTPLSALAPFWKVIYEMSMGRSAFTGRRFTAEDIYVPYGSDQPYKIIRNDAGDVVDVVPQNVIRPSIFEELFSQVPLYNLIKRTWAHGAVYSTATLSDIMRGHGVIRDPATGEPLYPESVWEGLLGWVGLPGVNVYEVNIADYQAKLAKEREMAMRFYTEPAGVSA